MRIGFFTKDWDRLDASAFHQSAIGALGRLPCREICGCLATDVLPSAALEETASTGIAEAAQAFRADAVAPQLVTIYEQVLAQR
jgi:hypothetical protein